VPGRPYFGRDMKRLCTLGFLAVGVVASGCSAASTARSAGSSSGAVSSVPVGVGVTSMRVTAASGTGVNSSACCSRNNATRHRGKSVRSLSAATCNQGTHPRSPMRLVANEATRASSEAAVSVVDPPNVDAPAFTMRARLSRVTAVWCWPGRE
jgi:hypothetical protein